MPVAAPRILHRLGLLSCLLLSLTLHGQTPGKRYRPAAHYVQMGQPDQAEGRRILENFRGQGLAGDYYLEFTLRTLPRRGEGRTVPGKLWGTRNEEGPLTRVTLQTSSPATEYRLLLQNGLHSALWDWPPRNGQELPSADLTTLFAPLAGTDLTAFDLQMPFLYWQDFVFEGVAPLRGRPAHVFLLYPPDNVATARPELTAVRVYLDTQFHALVQAVQIGTGDRPLKTTTVLDLKKVDEQWMVKTVDVREEVSRNKTQFLVQSAALGLSLSPALFAPAALADTPRPPPPERLRRLN